MKSVCSLSYNKKYSSLKVLYSRLHSFWSFRILKRHSTVRMYLLYIVSAESIMISGRTGDRSLSEPPFLVIRLLTRKMSTISLIVAIIEFQSVFSVLSVAVMRCRLVHCSSTFTALILPMLGKFVAAFPLAHTSRQSLTEEPYSQKVLHIGKTRPE